MKYLVVLFAIVAVVAANPEPERERRGAILAAPALAAPWGIPNIAAAPIALAPAAKVLAAPATLVGAPALAGWGGLKAW